MSHPAHTPARVLSYEGEGWRPAVGVRPRVGLPGSWRRIFLLSTLRARLVIIVLAIDVLAAVLAGTVIIYKAREATELEITSSMRLADLLVNDTIGLMKNAPPSLLLETIDLHFQSVRHVRITVADAPGRAVQAALSPEAQTASNDARAPDAPVWFSRLIEPRAQAKVLPVLLKNRLVGNVTIAPEPSDEIGEAWHYAHALLVSGFALNLLVLVTLFLLFGRVLAPLTALVGGLNDLEGRNFKVRLPRSSLFELATIADHFNRTAAALAAANEANHILNRRLLTAQDDERRRTAIELHDEVGPCLFALDVEASSIAKLTKDLPDGGRVHGRATDVVSLIKRVQGINRNLLDRLRPMGLGRIPLTECLFKILVDFDGDAYPLIEHEIGPLEATYGRLVDLTIYRCTQEGLLNAVRHARASRIILAIHELGAREEDRRIEMSIRDDGRGLQNPSRSGMGLSGMRERVEALCGRFELVSSLAGTTLAITVPLAANEIDDADPKDTSAR